MALLTLQDDETSRRRATTPTGTAVPRITPTTPAAPPLPTTPAAPGTPGGGENQDWPPPAPLPPTTPPAPAGPTYALEGFDSTKLANPAHTTLKYTFARLAQKYPPTPTGLSQLMQDPEFQKLGIQSVGNGNFRLPDGTIVDAIRGYNAGGYAWQWAPLTGGTTGATGTGTGGYGTGGYGTGSGSGSDWSGYIPGMGSYAGDYGIPGFGTLPGTSEFTDPTTANFETVLNRRIQELLNPVNDSARQQYANLLQQQVSALSMADPAITDLINSLQQLGATTRDPSQAEITAGNLGMNFQQQDPAFLAQAQQRIGQLRQDPYTGAEWEAYRTHALDPIEADRTAAQQRALARISDQGIDPSSGIAQALQAETDRGFDQSRAQAQNQLALSRVAEREKRQGQAFDIESALANLLQQRQLTGLDLLGQSSDRTFERMGLGAQTYGALADIMPARTAQQLQGAETLSNLSQSVRQEEEARRAQAITLQGLLAELPERRLQLALATLGQGEAPSSLSNSLLALAGLSDRNAQVSQQQGMQGWSGLGSLLGYLANLKGGGSNNADAYLGI